ncbi:hypothetical protein GGTG_04811 [Gaeumannomyces tritici R3-111a-1]|uniref:Uncharacterized protein n=1 Tax=Gaeumannomyces tritici (strain R3-111a-1) TaxID=644352 RepID=J3NU56_GAET3|nr:hypothetical protein GGTG_04811 [Gaeumannomyces tritici R3-111a-1]EJT79727.1 hypothetical protein GGTG_04811 [Gaeumannomyces tritici R3-111a-1]
MDAQFPLIRKRRFYLKKNAFIVNANGLTLTFAIAFAVIAVTKTPVNLLTFLFYFLTKIICILKICRKTIKVLKLYYLLLTQYKRFVQ